MDVSNTPCRRFTSVVPAILSVSFSRTATDPLTENFNVRIHRMFSVESSEARLTTYDEIYVSSESPEKWNVVLVHVREH
jgi:hypothetical protein